MRQRSLDMQVWSHERRQAEDLPQVWRKEALDASPTRHPTVDRLVRALFPGGSDIRAAGEALHLEGVDGLGSLAPPPIREEGTEEGWLRQDESAPPAEGGVDGVRPEVIGQGEAEAGAGELWRISHYTCLEENWGGTHYCAEGDRTASGVPVGPGVAACGAEYLGHMVRVDGWDLLCADTGNLVVGNTIDIHCYSYDHWGAPGTPEYKEACPSPCEQVIYGPSGIGHCWALAEVIVE